MTLIEAAEVKPPANDPSAASLEAELLGRWAAGEVGAFDSLVQMFHGRVVQLAFRLMGWSGEEADDVVQVVFVAFWQAGGAARQSAPVWPWLAGVTVNRCRMRRRWWGRYRMRLRLHAENEMAGAGSHETPVERETSDRVRSAVASLNGRDREVIVLRYLEEMSLADVARVLGVPLNTAEVRLHRARKRLEPLLAGLMKE